MRIAEINSYGIFDAAERFKGATTTAKREIPDFELEFVVSGGGKTYIDGKAYALRSNTFVVRKPGQTSFSEPKFKCYFVHISLPADGEFYELLSGFPDYYRFINADEYRAVTEKLVGRLITEGNEPGDLMTNALLLELFALLLRDKTKNAADGGDNPRYGEAVDKAISIIESHYAERITLSVLAGAVNYSPNYFHRLFLTCVGKSPQEYILGYRVKQAKLRLTSTRETLSEVAYGCGFSSQSYFSLCFKRATGLTPKEYRKMNNNVYPG